ncbi:GspH/FimT family pseudopilin [Pseudocolwellia agarivorans]|uniref:GspH/FimT family pseudopilin n=1 Tax=Pseudocolwellia agarivorans TaxID=1911682 RepID=UPI0009847C5C|nr:GspH/FimT family protein [Pseudocolwellia agarivorans]
MRIKNIKQKAFTLVELLVGISVISIITIIALPSLSKFVIDMRVDNQISELYRLLNIARNASVNSGQNVVICPLVANTCTNDWTREISVFINTVNDNTLDLPADEIVRVKSALSNNDRFQYSGGASLTYNALGNLTSNTAEDTFSYCPEGVPDASRGIIISISGRAYISQDNNNDGIDEDRNNNPITCI